MTRVATFLLLFAGIFSFSMTGCGGHSEQVVQPPADAPDDASLSDIDEEAYNKEMEEAMNRQQ